MKKKDIILLSLGAAAVAQGGLMYAMYRKGLLPHANPVTRVKEGDIKVACVGDSITYGHGITPWPRASYPAVLSGLLGEGYCVRNFGFSGRTASMDADQPYSSERLYKRSLEFGPDIVVIMLGTNDAKPYNWLGAENYCEDLTEIIKSYQDLPSRPQILLLMPLPVWEQGEDGVMYDIDAAILSEEIRPAVKTVAENTGAILVDPGDAEEWGPELFSDGVHPNADGAKKLAETVFSAMPERDAEEE